MTDLIIDDGYVKSLGAYYKGYSNQLQNAVDKYISTVEKVKGEAVTSGEFTEALDAFIQHANSLKDVISSLGNEIESSCIQFIEEVDDRDSYIY